MQNTQSSIRALPSEANGKRPEVATLPNPLLSRIKRILPHREDLTVAGREVKGGIVIHPIIATAILGAIIASATFMYRSFSTELSWQHDKLITLSVQKDEADKRAAEKAEDLAKRLQNMDAVQIVLGRDIVKLQEAQKNRN